MKAICLTLISLFSISCFGQDPIKLNVGEIYNSRNEVKLSEIGTEINYVQLETTEDCYFSKINKIIIDDLIYVSASEGLFVFTKDGKFIRSIGKKGRGPTEYNSKIDFVVNNDTVAILDITQHKIMQFKNDGTYLGYIKFQNFINKLFTTSNSYYVLNTDPPGFWGLSDTGTLLTIYDKNGNVHSIRNRNPALPSCCKNSYEFNDVVFFRQTLNDTVFSCANGELSANYIVDLGKYKPQKAIGNVKDVSKIINCGRILETNRFQFLWLSDWNKTISFCIYNKIERNLKIVDADGLQNDLDMGASMFPKEITNNTLINTLWYHNIYELISQKKAGKRLTEIFEQMDMNSNPVLMLVKLKE